LLHRIKRAGAGRGTGTIRASIAERALAVSLQGEVMHFQPNFGFAVHFTELSEAQMSSLAALLAYAQT
jgi:hypothetical protein